MIPIAKLRAAVKDALAYVSAQPGVAEAEVFASANGRRVPGGLYRVILGPQPLAEILELVLMPSLQLDMFYAGASSFMGKLGLLDRARRHSGPDPIVVDNDDKTDSSQGQVPSAKARRGDMVAHQARPGSSRTRKCYDLARPGQADRWGFANHRPRLGLLVAVRPRLMQIDPFGNMRRVKWIPAKSPSPKPTMSG